MKTIWLCLAYLALGDLTLTLIDHYRPDNATRMRPAKRLAVMLAWWLVLWRAR